ncbi:hypothetical protein KHO57_gp129 [Mycobacterium phage Phabba]|uniref:Uncharacterized protein n=1 Tax=Mycobacterium phage Phabba TaxID=2027899 RepID=A0A249XSQ2_9CAUD|nr:hypothetical protein KHO57_gp129 [Mycobacterium phage Phabba]ASZ74775.1 hypothetical protein SEA_PHABBA_238 [Mycobacterium phage Phabba]
MKKTRKYKPKTPQTEKLDSIEITVSGRKRQLSKPNEVRLVGKPGRPEARYRFEFAERRPDGKVILNVFGPVGRVTASMRYVDPADVIVYHKAPQKPRRTVQTDVDANGKTTSYPVDVCSNCLAPVAAGQDECGNCRD